MATDYHELFVKNGIPVSTSDTLNDCLSEFIVKRGQRSTSVFDMIRYILNIHDEENRRRAGLYAFGARWEDVTQEEIEDYLNLSDLERVPEHSISKQDVEDLKMAHTALGDLIESLEGERNERAFEDALARYYVAFAKLTKE